MPRYRNWEEGLDDSIKFLHTEGNHVFCMKDGFTFRVSSGSFPPKKFSPDLCITPTEFFKFQVKQVHGDKYDLNLVDYKGMARDVQVICKQHGTFSIRASYLKNGGRGCQVCSRENSANTRTLDTETFISRATEVHGGRYDYHRSVYTKAKCPVEIVCKLHGSFTQLPGDHIFGKGCTKCGHVNTSQAKTLTQTEVISRFKSVHGDRYCYSKVVYINSKSKLEISCHDHGSFLQNYASHYHQKCGCPICAKEFSARYKSGFIKSSKSKNGYASLYLIRCTGWGESFYKIGITTKSIKSRFCGINMPYDYSVEHVYIGDAEFIWDLESLLHREYKLDKYVPEREFGGRYECFSNIDVAGYKKLLEVMC